MSCLFDYYNKFTTKDLMVELQLIQKKVDDNDGRLSSSSSYDLDYNFDKLDEVKKILSLRV